MASSCECLNVLGLYTKPRSHRKPWVFLKLKPMVLSWMWFIRHGEPTADR